MGIGIVLIFWGVVGTVLAVIGSVVLSGIASSLTASRSRQLVFTVRRFPFACLFWAGAVFVLYAVVNTTIFDRDPALGDTWWCPLPNGYAIEMIDVTDRGWVYNPRTKHDGLLTESPDAVADVCVLQLAGPYVLGGTNCRMDVSPDAAGQPFALSYFMLDTRRGTHTAFRTYDDLRGAAGRVSVQPRLEPIHVVYGRYRFTWFDAVTVSALFGIPAICTCLLFWWIIRVRRYGVMLPHAA